MPAEPTPEFLNAAEIEAQTPITVGIPANEQLAKQFRDNRAEGEGPEGTAESLLRCAAMLDAYAPDLYPANEKGQVSFSRAMMESVADEIRAFVPRAIAAERERDSLKAELADGEVAGEDYCRVIRALEAEKAEAVQLLRHCRTSIEYFGGGRGFETIEALDTFLAKHAAKRNEPSPFGVGSKVPGVAQSPDGGSVAAPRPGV